MRVFAACDGVRIEICSFSRIATTAPTAAKSCHALSHRTGLPIRNADHAADDKTDEPHRYLHSPRSKVTARRLCGLAEDDALCRADRHADTREAPAGMLEFVFASRDYALP
jgi:hypothetical protein